MAHDLAQHYGGACLSIDNVVTDVLMKPSSAVALRARQLYDAATAAQSSDRKAKEPGERWKTAPLQNAVGFKSSKGKKFNLDAGGVVVVLSDG